VAEIQQHEADPRISNGSSGTGRRRVLHPDFLEHAQKIVLIVVLAVIWIVFRVPAAAPDVAVALPPASVQLPTVVGEPVAAEKVAPSLVVHRKPGNKIGDRVLTLPVQGVGPEELYDSFNDKRGRGRRHRAIDIIAKSNTPVLAVENGTIARLENHPLGGLSIYQFDPTVQYVDYYAHLARYARGLKEGDHVSRGDVIGRVGQTGNAETPHLHFAISRLSPGSTWWGGEAINPYPILLNAQPSEKAVRQTD